MNPILRSIDSLLNRFDELSQNHASFITSFNTNFTDIENPLRDVARDEEEQQKTAENLLSSNIENSIQIGSFATIEDFNRRVTKIRCHNRPPSYSPNDNSSFFHRVSSRNSWITTESAPPPRKKKSASVRTTIQPSNSQPIPSTSINNRIESKIQLTTKILPKVLPRNPSVARQYTYNTITTFTVETVNRLSKPKKYYQLPEQKVSSKRIHRRLKSYQNIKKEAPVFTITSISLPSPLPQIKRTNPTITKRFLKKLKTNNRFATENSKRIPINNYPRRTIFLTPPPTISLTFPIQPELKSSPVVVIPKAATTTTTKKTTSIFPNKRYIIPPNRMINLMT